jgi:hypothetical protein
MMRKAMTNPETRRIAVKWIAGIVECIRPSLLSSVMAAPQDRAAITPVRHGPAKAAVIAGAATRREAKCWEGGARKPARRITAISRRATTVGP